MRNPSRYVHPFAWLTIRRREDDFRSSVARDLFNGRCDSGAPDGIGEDDFLGMTAADYVAHALATGLTWWAPDDGAGHGTASTTDAGQASGITNPPPQDGNEAKPNGPNKANGETQL